MTDNKTTKTYSYKTSLIRCLTYAAFGMLFFTYGLTTGINRWQPFGLIQETKATVTQWIHQLQPAEDYRGEQELLQYAFTDPVIENDLYHPSITLLDRIRKANQSIFMLRNGFETAYENRFF